ncbi:hypothetical protein MRB53_010374 [Persea americana]|uniref:Uncharacterized protein n=1 Tax=Persea americana TaxID=3435 RepID=A0ACC2LSP2_PERAE|nr:hypothetical protein MRB53_010374 [Persea americana]
MKKLYGKGKVHPSPSPSGVVHHPSDHVAALLCNLPATMITLTAALQPEEREVLAYLISSTWKFSENCNREMKKKKKEHPPHFNCICFRCYMSFWARWDSSPNRHLIHEILDAFENSQDSAMIPKNKRKVERHGSERVELGVEISSTDEEMGVSEIERESSDGNGTEGEKGSVRRFVSFLGERIWGVWNQ